MIELLPANCSPLAAFRAAKSRGLMLIERNGRYAMSDYKPAHWRRLFLYSSHPEAA